MRDASRQQTEAFQLLRLPEPLFGLLALGHVEHLRQNGTQLAIIVVNRGIVPLALNYRAVLAVIAISAQISRTFAIEHILGYVPDQFDIVDVHPRNLGDRASDDLLRPPAEHPLGLPGPTSHPELAVKLDYVQRRGGHRPHTALRG